MSEDHGAPLAAPARRWSDRLGDPPTSLFQQTKVAYKNTQKSNIVGESDALKSVLEQARLFAQCDAPVLITGESGTGKELLAKYIHRHSPMASGPFVDLNCAGIPATLISSELFGHERGAFTHAVQRRVGRIEAADRGTLFLDEIGDMPVDLQPFLLRFLEERQIQRVGGQQSIDLNVRIIAATNQNLDGHVEASRFRQDLLFRLNVLSLELPPLRERGSDVLLLAVHALSHWSRPGDLCTPQLTDAAKAALMAHHWPGNVRELMGRMRRALVLAQGQPITPEHLRLQVPGGPLEDCGQPSSPQRVHGGGCDAKDSRAGTGVQVEIPLPCTLGRAHAEVERAVISFAMQRRRNNLSAVARDIGISRGTLYKLIKHYSLTNDDVQTNGDVGRLKT